ncbi:tyrosine-type recombinase/integrase [Proteus mirabilis]|nr:tyrosine-type recombinase/integrase [Proteus mirabilis]MBG2951236.1 tyrosine-type recombinase/integrase [Proteus mirabilis]
MSIKSIKEGYLVDIRPNGVKGKRFRKKFAIKSEAIQYEKWILSQYHNKEWLNPPADRRKLSELIELWWKYHGQLMKSGRSALLKLKRIDKDMGYPTINRLDARSISDYRIVRIEKGIKPKTINRELSALSGMFISLIESGHFNQANPIREVSALKTFDHEMGYLTKEQCLLLIDNLKGLELLAVKLCLNTGARWGEVLNLTGNQVRNGKVTFVNGKNGKNRTVPISKNLEDELCEIKEMKLFNGVSYDSIRKNIQRVAPNLPKGQALHVLRHTFASHFIMNGGNILTLQKLLGHSSIQQTMKYAHLAPDYLLDAIRLNPLAEE